MSQLSQHQIEQISARSGVSRYNYFIKTVVEFEEVYGLADDEGWVMLEDDVENCDVIPFFPNPEFAEVFRTAAKLEENRVEPLDLMEFMDWLDDFAEEKIKIGVFLNGELQGAIMDASRLKTDLQAALGNEIGDETE